MTQVKEDVEVSSAEAFRAAADAARQAISVGIPEDAAPSTESGSSPAIGAESVVTPEATPAPEVAATQETQPEVVKPEGTVIDPDAAWNEYKDEDARKKALAHNKAYAAEMSRRVKELESKLAEKPSEVVPAVTAPEVVVDEPVVEAEPQYDEWVKKALKEPDTDQKRRVAELASEYNQLVAEKVVPAKTLLDERETKVREAAELVKEREIALKFLRTKKDQGLFEADIAEAKDAFLEARAELNDAKTAKLEAASAFERAEMDRIAMLGILRSDSRSNHQAEIASRRDSASKSKAKEEAEITQKAIDEAWEKAKSDAIKARGVDDEEAKRFLSDAADGAIVRAANLKKPINVDDFAKFIEDSWKPFHAGQEKARQEAVRNVIDISAEPAPSKATSDKPNLDAQPSNLEEWQKRARAVMGTKP